MSNDKAVEKTVEKSQEKGVEEKDNKAPVVEEEMVTISKSEVEKLTKTAEEAINLASQKSEDAENYKKGMLVAKGKLKENGIDDEEVKPKLEQSDIKQMIQDALKEVIPTLVKPVAEDDSVNDKTKIEEMRIALSNSRKGMSSAAGSNVGKEEAAVKTEAKKFFSPAQIEDMEKKYPGINIEEVYKNLPKSGDMVGAPQA